MANDLALARQAIITSVAEHTTNKRRLAMQLLDGEARTWLRRALWADLDAAECELRDLRKRRALDRLRGREWADDGAFLVAQLDRRYRAMSALLDALD